MRERDRREGRRGGVCVCVRDHSRPHVCVCM